MQKSLKVELGMGVLRYVQPQCKLKLKGKLKHTASIVTEASGKVKMCMKNKKRCKL